MITTISEFATIVGPPLAGVLITWTNPAVVITIDAISFAVLAATYRLAVPAAGSTDRAGNPDSPRAGFNAIRRDRTLVGLLTLSFGFFFLFGPFYVAMPIRVAEDLHASATVVGARAREPRNRRASIRGHSAQWRRLNKQAMGPIPQCPYGPEI